jgi:3-dehydroquinate synthetase
VDRVAGSAAAIFAHDPDVLHAVVRRSLEIKAEVVAEDERETGRRAILNFGHTVAHAIETVTGFELLHGEAVAIGMLIEADIGARIGVTAPGVPADLRSALEALELPLDLPDRPPVDYLSAMDADKKNRAGAVHFSLLSDIGAPARNKTGNWTFSVDRTVIESALRSTS